MKSRAQRYLAGVAATAVFGGAIVCLLSLTLGADRPPEPAPTLVPSGVTIAVKTAPLAPTVVLPGQIRSTQQSDVISHYGYWVNIQWLAPEGSQILKGDTAALVVAGNLSDRAATAAYCLEDAEADAAAKEARVGLKDAERRLTVQRAQWDREEAELELALLKAGPGAQKIHSAELAVKRAGLELAASEASVSRLGQLTGDVAISREKIAEAEHARDLARFRLSQSENDLALLKRGPHPAELLAAQAKVQQAEAALTAAQASAEAVRQKDATEVAQSEAQADLVCARGAELAGSLKAMTRPATASGTVLWPSIYKGGKSRPGVASLWATPILTIVDPKQAVFVARASEDQVSRLKAGMAVQVRLSGVAGGPLPGKVATIAATSEDLASWYQFTEKEQTPRTRVQMYEVIVALERAGGPDLYQGTAGQAEVRIAEPASRTVVPRACVETIAGKDWVSVRAGGRWVPRQVVLGDGDAQCVAVEKGLRPGERVAVLAR